MADAKRSDMTDIYAAVRPRATIAGQQPFVTQPILGASRCRSVFSGS
ncbi:hypothetical protein SPHINGO8AM_30500 [Sphingomonas sp. 8AM]|nr:hypothetical protein SPHINGO8AM_30500 [Sphingomonas sp. 8AM]